MKVSIIILNGGGYQAIIGLDTNKPKALIDTDGLGRTFFFRLSLSLARSLKKAEIPFIFWPKYSCFGHIYGTIPNLKFVPGASYVDGRFQLTSRLISESIRTFPNEFNDKELDIWIQLTDGPLGALDLAEAINLPYVFAYASSYSLKDRLIAMIDFNTYYDESVYPFKDRLPSKCKEAAKEPWQYNKVFWSRRCLFELGKKYPEYLHIEDGTRGQFVPMFEQARYKYLIDTRGTSWSGRLQTLLQLGRVVFIADRPFREWYFDRLIPMKHYVPIKEDMSDLIEKYLFMERNPELYDRIVHNMEEFVEENLNPRRILFDTKELILKYGVVQNNLT